MGGQLDLLVERRRDKAVVEKRLRKLLKKQRFAPDVKGQAALLWRGKFKRRLSACHDQRFRTNNRAQNSHHPTRRRERKI
jgi:putative transposase